MGAVVRWVCLLPPVTRALLSPLFPLSKVYIHRQYIHISISHLLRETNAFTEMSRFTPKVLIRRDILRSQCLLRWPMVCPIVCPSVRPMVSPTVAVQCSAVPRALTSFEERHSDHLSCFQSVRLGLRLLRVPFNSIYFIQFKSIFTAESILLSICLCLSGTP